MNYAKVQCVASQYCTHFDGNEHYLTTVLDTIFEVTVLSINRCITTIDVMNNWPTCSASDQTYLIKAYIKQIQKLPIVGPATYWDYLCQFEMMTESLIHNEYPSKCEGSVSVSALNLQMAQYCQSNSSVAATLTAFGYLIHF